MTSPKEFRTNPGYAQGVIEELLPNEETRRGVLERISGTIEEAHRINAASWELSVAQSRRYIRLNVGGIAALGFSKGFSEIALLDAGKSLSSDDGPLPSGALKYTYSALKGVSLYHVSHDQLLSHWSLLSEPHLEAVRLATRQMSQSPWAAFHAPGAVQFIAQVVGRELPEPTYRDANGDQPIARFAEYFAEFVEKHLRTPKGEEHLATYERHRQVGRENFEAIVEAAEKGEDTTDDVILKLLPYSENKTTKERGAWIHVGPVFSTDARRKFEGSGWVKPQDWPGVSRAILDLVRKCNGDPARLEEACGEFLESGHSRGFQSGTISPILNALRPDDFLLINKKPRAVINWLSGAKLKQGLSDYPEINSIGRELVDNLSEAMLEIAGVNARSADLFDQFCHWAVAVRKPSLPPGSKTRKRRYWKIAPGSNAHAWDQCRRESFIGISWEQLGDVSELTLAQFKTKVDEVRKEHPDWKKNRLFQVWKFRTIKPGDIVIANRGTKEIVGVGVVEGGYHFVPDHEYGHQAEVRWILTDPIPVDETGWKRTLISLDEEKALALVGDVIDDLTGDDLPGASETTDSLFSDRTFELLAGLHQTPKKSFYMEHKEDIKEYVEAPIRELLTSVAAELPEALTSVLETKKGIFSRILKNDFGRGGAWHWYWGAFHPLGGKKTDSAQLFASASYADFEFGFSVADAAQDIRKRFARNCKEYGSELLSLLEDSLSDPDLIFASREKYLNEDGPIPEKLSELPKWSEWLKHPGEGDDIRAVHALSAKESVEISREELVQLVRSAFENLFPLVLLATSDDPLPAIEAYVGIADDTETPAQPEYPLADCARETGFPEPELARWVRAIDRKKQAVLYGPPGTGKTYIAKRLAKHLIGGKTGFSDLVQFHPAYAYEDFIQGIRPNTDDGDLTYDLEKGRFLEFCRKAGRTEDPCVLIIDEINRANLARVFGELMYLLEYRNQSVPLAGGGTFKIPDNVRIIGTMNTADRSIALVDHALRRRFAFLKLQPLPEVLAGFHRREKTGFDTAPLIKLLDELNAAIADPNYEVGITFFLREHLDEEIEDIWRMEIEPYLEEYFFSDTGNVENFRWANVAKKLGR